MDKYLDSFREMIFLRNLTDHTLQSYCTYICAYPDYPADILHKSPEDVSRDGTQLPMPKTILPVLPFSRKQRLTC